MEWKQYLDERIVGGVELATKATQDSPIERPLLLRLASFVKTFQEGTGDTRLVIMFGLRGIGKSTILFQLYKRLLEGRLFSEPVASKRVKKENILYVTIEQTLLQSQYEESKSPILEVAKNFVEKIHGKTFETLDKKLYLLIDEAQFDSRWALAVKSIFDSTKNIFIVVTGSSAMALNLNTDTARRAIKEPLFPLSFMEYEIIKNRVFPIKGTSNNLKELILRNNVSAIPELNTSITAIKKNMVSKRLDLNSEINDYLALGGFPYGMISTKEITYRRLVDMMNRIVSQDIPLITNYETDTIPHIIRLIGALALKPSGEITQGKLSQTLSIPVAKVNSILDALEKAHLIFVVKPYPKAPKDSGLNRGFKYFFMSPTLLSAIQYINGKINLTGLERSLLWETAVGSSLFRLCFTSGGTEYKIFYDPRKETNVDFILQNPLSGEIIPFEVGLNKDNSQIQSAIDDYETTHGIVITDVDDISTNGKIIKMPFWMFINI